MDKKAVVNVIFLTAVALVAVLFFSFRSEILYGSGDDSPPSSRSTTTTLPVFRWDPAEDNLALAQCIVDLVGMDHLESWRDYRQPTALCLAEINPIALLHHDVNYYASCIDAVWSWEPPTVELAAGNFSGPEGCFNTALR